MARLQAPQQPHCQGPPLLGHSFCAPVTVQICSLFLYYIKQIYAIDQSGILARCCPQKSFQELYIVMPCSEVFAEAA